MKFVAIRQHKDGGQTVIEYFATQEECLRWIAEQPQPKDDSWHWAVGEY